MHIAADLENEIPKSIDRVGCAKLEKDDLGAYASSGAENSPLEQTLLTGVSHFVRRAFVHVNP